MQDLRRTIRAMLLRARAGNAGSPAPAGTDEPIDTLIENRVAEPAAEAVLRLEERIALWGDPRSTPMVSGWSTFHRGISHANDAKQSPVPVSQLTAADFGCLAQAAMLMGLSRAAEELTAAAFSRLEDQISANAQPAAESLREALTPIGLFRSTDRP